MAHHEIVVAWKGLPAYGARLIRAGRERLDCDFHVLATKPDVPIQGMEEILGGNLTWIDARTKPSWRDLQIPVPKVFIHTGWGYPFFLSLADEVRSSGGKVVGMFDNCWKGNFRQLLGGLYFRFFRRRHYAAVWVPGKSARGLAKYIGFSDNFIFEGMYGADPKVFEFENEAFERPKKLLFVGRLIDRKGVLELAAAFEELQQDFPEWSLEVVGSGPLDESLYGRANIVLRPFKQPGAIAEMMNQSRIFVLASREEHWGLVVHEAALCGCALALRSSIGAAADLAGKRNAVLFEETTVSSIRDALREILAWDDDRFTSAASESADLAANFGPKIWAKRLEEILEAV